MVKYSSTCTQDTMSAFVNVDKNTFLIQPNNIASPHGAQRVVQVLITLGGVKFWATGEPCSASVY